MITDGRKWGVPCGPKSHAAPVSARKPTKIRIRPRLNGELVNEASHRGLDVSRIVEEALIREIEAERRRRQADRDQDCEGDNRTGSGTTKT
jgi:post-segregation antitoxin (ccd killing protein)